ncbi:MAG: response regulator transcription factor [Actinomycetia bacterium]|nr:response regulator transcription factor [Actinomycetes bacterium]
MRILVVEDEELIAQSIHDSLTAEGYAVDRAVDGTNGLWMATEQTYDAILLDIMLPGINGFVVCQQLRERGIVTPIMMISAKAGEFDQAEGLDTGADDYLTKPFSLVVLNARLRALIRRGPADRPAVLEVGSLRLDPARRTVTRNGEAIELTPREFALLQYLMHQAGRPVRKRELIEQVWGDDDLEANVLQVYIGYLRRKIDEPFGTDTIETIRGIGYRIDAAPR